MKKSLYATIQTTDGELLTFGTEPFAKRDACVEALCAIYREDLLNGTYFEVPEAEAKADRQVDDMRKMLKSKNVFVDDTTEYAVVELWIDTDVLANAEETKKSS